MSEPETEAAAREKQNRQIVWGGCQTVLGFGGILLFLFLFDWKAAAVWRHLSLAGESRDLIVLVDFKSLANEMFWCAAFAPLVLLGAASFGKSLRTSVMAAGVCLALMAVLALGRWFNRFVALEAQGNTVRLVHLWPRPATTFETSTITSTAVEETLTGGDGVSRVIERLVIETTHGTYRSMYGGDAAGANQRLKSLR